MYAQGFTRRGWRGRVIKLSLISLRVVATDGMNGGKSIAAIEGLLRLIHNIGRNMHVMLMSGYYEGFTISHNI